jgi:hypothetical protein
MVCNTIGRNLCQRVGRIYFWQTRRFSPKFKSTRISIEDVSDQNVLKAKFTELNCENCAAILIGDEFDSEYVQNINRGGLTVPSNIVIAIGKHKHKNYA